MLAKLERAYLGILRVVILVAATVALVVAGLGAVSAVPPLLRWSGITETTKPTGGTLADFISEQKITDTASTETTEQTAEPFIHADIRSAAKTIKGYLKGSLITEKEWQTGLQRLADQVTGHSVEYAESLKDLTEQLKSSKGKPLSEARVTQLIDWHKARFEADVAARAAAEAEGNAKFWVTIGLAGAAFLAFVLIIFVFLFVKIERSLRLVHTTRIRDEAHVDA
jgi:hypothetical protein